MMDVCNKNEKIQIEITKSELISIISGKYPTDELIKMGVLKQYGYNYGLYGSRWFWLSDELSKLSMDELKTINDVLSNKFEFEVKQ